VSKKEIGVMKRAEGQRSAKSGLPFVTMIDEIIWEDE